MSFARRIALFVTGSLLRISIYATVTITALVLVFGNAATVKSVIREQKTYDRFVPALIDASKNNTGKSSIPLDDPIIQNLINQSFPPKQLQTATENVINGTYNWLVGKTILLKFEVDFTSSKETLAFGLTNYAFQKLENQPACKVQPTELDPFSATCLPKGYNLPKEKAAFYRQIVDSKDFLSNPVLTADSLPKDQKGRRFTTTYSYAPRVFQWAKKAPLLLGGATFLLSILFIFLSKTKRIGIQNYGFGVLSMSFTLIITPFVIEYVIPHFTKNLTPELGGGGVQAIFDDVITKLNSQINSLILNVGIQMALLGLMLLFFEKVTRPTSAYIDIPKKSGLLSSNPPKPPRTSKSMHATDVPIQTSEGSKSNKRLGKKNSVKYRNIRSGGI
jgi:hypothetical protein